MKFKAFYTVTNFMIRIFLEYLINYSQYYIPSLISIDDNVNYPDQQARKRYQQLLEDRNLAMTQQNVTAWQRIEQFWAEKYFMFSRA